MPVLQACTQGPGTVARPGEGQRHFAGNGRPHREPLNLLLCHRGLEISLALGKVHVRPEPWRTPLHSAATYWGRGERKKKNEKGAAVAMQPQEGHAPRRPRPDASRRPPALAPACARRAARTCNALQL